MINYYSPKRKSAVYLFFLKSVIMPIQTDKVTIHTIITIIHPPIQLSPMSNGNTY